jgi:hypothetical protein
LNRTAGGLEFLETQARDSYQHPHGDDVAALPLAMDFSEIKYHPVDLRMFLTPELVESEDIGIGDETFMVGRFINHEGKQRNAPAIRFGSIAMMAEEKMTTDFGTEQESFLVEIRSLPAS